jgi:hypothetical protein
VDLFVRQARIGAAADRVGVDLSFLEPLDQRQWGKPV